MVVSPVGIRSRQFRVALLGPPMAMTATAVGLGLCSEGFQIQWAGVFSLGFLVAPVLGVVAFLSAFQMRLMSFRTILVAAIYMYAIFWISAGAAMYVGALFLELLGHPVGF